MFFRLLTVIVNSIKGFIVFRKADCSQLGNHQKQHVGTKQEEPHGGPRWNQSSPSSEIPLSYGKTEIVWKDLSAVMKLFCHLQSAQFSPPALQCPPSHQKDGSGGGGISENTGQRWNHAKSDESIWWAYWNLRPICKSFWGNYICYHSKITRTTNRNVGGW